MTWWDIFRYFFENRLHKGSSLIDSQNTLVVRNLKIYEPISYNIFTCLVVNVTLEIWDNTKGIVNSSVSSLEVETFFVPKTKKGKRDDIKFCMTLWERD